MRLNIAFLLLGIEELKLVFLSSKSVLGLIKIEGCRVLRAEQLRAVSVIRPVNVLAL